jgi:translation initiation factor IF-3
MNRDRGRMDRKDSVRVNDRIRAPKVRVINGATGEQLGVLRIREALDKAVELGLDLVEIAPNADPPVCKIVDFGKYKYEKAKQQKEQHKNKSAKIKEVKFRPGIDAHDYKIKVTHIEDFLHEGNKVKIQLQFRGRQNAHPEIGFQLLAQVQADLKTMGHVDVVPRHSGRHITMQMSPLPIQQRVRKWRLQGDNTPPPPAHDDSSDHDDDEDDDEDDGED